MNKEEILAKSRAENKEKDLAQIEAENKACTFALLVGVVFAAVLYVIQIVTANGSNYSLWAMMTVINAAIHYYKYYSLKNKKNLTYGIVWTVVSVIVTASAIMNFIN